MKRVLLIAPKIAANAYYRCWMPARYCYEECRSAGIDLRWSYSPNFGDFPDVIVAQACNISGEALYYFDALKHLRGTKIVWDLDDDYWHPSPHDRLRDLALAMKPVLDEMLDVADFINVPTERMVNVVNRPGKTTILPNLVEESSFLELTKPDELLNVVFTGSEIHEEDVCLLNQAVKETKGLCNWVFFGCRPSKEVAEKVVFEPWGPLQNYHAGLASLKPGVIVAPLLPTLFNAAKSPIKFFEAAAVGAAFVGTDCPVYSGVVRHGIDGLLARPVDWTSSIHFLIHQPELRESLISNARKKVLKEHCWQSPEARRPWIDFFKKVAA